MIRGLFLVAAMLVTNSAHSSDEDPAIIACRTIAAIDGPEGDVTAAISGLEVILTAADGEKYVCPFELKDGAYHYAELQPRGDITYLYMEWLEKFDAIGKLDGYPIAPEFTKLGS